MKRGTLSFRRILQMYLLVFILIFTTKFFQSTPFETLFFQLQGGFFAVVLLFLLFYIFDILVKKKPIKKTISYFILLILIIPIYSAYRAHIEFEQPYLYGILSERGWLFIAIGVWFYYVLSNKKITFSTLEASFLFMAWGSLIIYSLIVITYDPSQFSGETKFVIMTKYRGLRFSFQNFFITFGTIYFFIKYSLQKKILDLLVLLMFLAFIIFVIQGRTYIIYLVSIFLLYYYNNYTLSRFVLNIVKIFLFLIGVFVILQIFMPDYIQQMSELFMQMFIVLEGAESIDPSSNARIFESAIVLHYFEVHPLSILLGTGRISHQWNEGYSTLFGYFYPLDIGLLGGTFLYGIVGMSFLLIVPLILEIKEIRKSTDRSNIFIMTIKYMLIMSILRIAQGGFYFGPGVWIVLFFILYAHNRFKEGK